MSPHDNKRPVAYVFAEGVGLAILLTVAIVLVACGESESTSAPEETTSTASTLTATGSASIQPLSGSDNGVAGDERAGTEPPAVEQGDLDAAAEAAGCVLQLDLPDEGNTHLTPSDPPPDYKTNPPTSGSHIAPPLQQADGAYSESPRAVAYVHSLEHGRVAIQYSPDLGEDEQLALKGVFDASPAGMLLFPASGLPDAIAVMAWTQLMSCPSYEGPPTLDAIRAFRDAYRGNGPEPVPIELAG